MFVFVGLGNPGSEYEKTRHNAGFMALDTLAHQHNLSWRKEPKFDAFIAEWRFKGNKALLVKPQTYMNRSGQSVKAIQDFYKLKNEDFVVLYDDVALPTGQIRLRESGTAGGQNGVQNIIQHLGTNQFKRIRIGIGLRPAQFTLTNFVLGCFSAEESKLLEAGISDVIDAMGVFESGVFSKAMERFNQKAVVS
jgi:peptidyl-tRNA hydrolase, PTH1 family